MSAENVKKMYIFLHFSIYVTYTCIRYAFTIDLEKFGKNERANKEIK